MRRLIRLWPWLVLAGVLFAGSFVGLRTRYLHRPTVRFDSGHASESHRDSTHLKSVSPDGAYLLTESDLNDGHTQWYVREIWDLRHGGRARLPVEEEPNWRELVQIPGSEPLIWDDAFRAAFRQYYAQHVRPHRIWAEPQIDRPPDAPILEYPAGAWFIGNGRFFVYPLKRGRPCGAWCEDKPSVGLERSQTSGMSRDATDLAIDEVTTGRRVATKTSVQTPWSFSWDDRYPKTSLGPTLIHRESGTLFHWGPRSRSTFWGPNPEYLPLVYELSGDGRYVFGVEYGPCLPMKHLQWWRIEGGQEVGHVLMDLAAGTVEWAGTTIVSVIGVSSEKRAVREVTFWDISTGQSTGHWQPDDLSTKLLPYLRLSADGRYAAVGTESKPGDIQGQVVIDTTEQQEVGRYPGSRSIFTPDGNRLVTLDEGGTIAVWDLRPTWRGYGRLVRDAFLATLAGLIVISLTRRYWNRRARRQADLQDGSGT